MTDKKPDRPVYAFILPPEGKGRKSRPLLPTPSTEHLTLFIVLRYTGANGIH
jgi:hypothetical protein